MNAAEKLNVYTDLAIESRENLGAAEEEIDGVRIAMEESGEVVVTRVEITSPAGAARMGKPMGVYVTIESESMKGNDLEAHEEISRILSEKIRDLARLPEEGSALVAGLGNWNVTPDALGPRVVKRLLVTRHMEGGVPPGVLGGARPVSALSPGVMGITGIETFEILRGVTDRVKPDLVIAIDALAARRTSRVNATIQMSDTGIAPGAGMGNRRATIDRESLGVPVIALGVPTVVDAATLVNDTLDCMLDEIIAQTQEGTAFYAMLRDLGSEEKYQVISQILSPYMGNLFVTPKEVDVTIDRLSVIIANALNMALHPGIGREDMNRYIN